ncbi:MAG: GatB/YqeY domain-containing protein [Thermomicrobiales bacterium]|nr:GatB/YqeY domain-containing protein [Thermomicrobiales bacterium]
MSESLRTRLETDMKNAMRAGEVVERDTIRFLLAALKNAEIEKRDALDEAEGQSLLQRQAKRMVEAIDQFRAGGRDDLAEREQTQLAILKRYLPAELSDDEVLALARAVVQETGASSAKDMGRVMSLLVERAAGRADGKRLSAAARTALSGDPA